MPGCRCGLCAACHGGLGLSHIASESASQSAAACSAPLSHHQACGLPLQLLRPRLSAVCTAWRQCGCRAAPPCTPASCRPDPARQTATAARCCAEGRRNTHGTRRRHRHRLTGSETISGPHLRPSPPPAPHCSPALPHSPHTRPRHSQPAPGAPAPPTAAMAGFKIPLDVSQGPLSPQQPSACLCTTASRRWGPLAAEARHVSTPALTRAPAVTPALP